MAVALFGQLLADLCVDARKIGLGDEVHHTRNRVGAVGRCRAARQDVDALHERQRNVVQIDATGQAGGGDAIAVQQNDVTRGTETAKIDERCARRCRC